MTIPHRERGKRSFREVSKEALLLVLRPLVRWLSVMRVRPDTLTVVGWTLALGAATLFGLGYVRVAGLGMLLGGIFDALDGAVARETNRMSSFGAFLDSTLDRMGDSAIFGGLLLYFAYVVESEVLAALSLYCLVTGWLTSYTRARAESLGYEAKEGIAARADRLVAVLVAAGLSEIFDVPVLLEAVLWLLAVASSVTVVQRILTVRRQARAAAV